MNEMYPNLSQNIPQNTPPNTPKKSKLTVVIFVLVVASLVIGIANMVIMLVSSNNSITYEDVIRLNEEGEEYQKNLGRKSVKISNESLIKPTTEYGSPELTGDLKNIGDKTLTQVSFSVRAYYDGEKVDVGSEYVYDLEPGDTYEFSVRFYETEKVDSYEIYDIKAIDY